MKMLLCADIVKFYCDLYILLSSMNSCAIYYRFLNDLVGIVVRTMETELVHIRRQMEELKSGTDSKVDR